MNSMWPNFTNDELTCHCGCGRMEMKHDFMEKLVALREMVGFSMPVTSGYRCPAHNDEVSSSGVAGAHTLGRAVDIAVSRDKATALVKCALGLDFRGIGLKQHGPESGRFVHLDIIDRPAQIIWTY